MRVIGVSPSGEPSRTSGSVVLGEDLRGGDRRGTGLADLYPGGVIRDDGGLDRRGPHREHRGEVGGHSIASPDDIEDLARGRRDVVDHPIGVDQSHPTLAQREQEPLGAQSVQDGGQRFRVLEIHRRAEGGLELPAVRLEDRRPAVGEEVPVLRVDDDGDTFRLGRGDRPMDHRFGEDALVVILEDQGIGIGDGAVDGEEEGLHLGPAEIGVDLLIDPHDLLAPRDDTGLGRGGAIDGDDPPRVGAEGGEHGAHALAGAVVPDGSDELELRTDGRDVLRDVGGPAERLHPVADADDGDGGLGGDPFDIAAQVDVEHRIPDDGDPAASSGWRGEESLEALAGQGGWCHGPRKMVTDPPPRDGRPGCAGSPSFTPMARLKPPAAVREICRTLEGAGFEAWCVGGAVRDALVGIETLDWDIATSARPEEVQRLFRRTVPVGIRFGTVGVLDRDGILHEVTTFRHDVETDGRHAVVRFGASLDEDLARRDFTINAIAVHAETLAIRDPFDGRGDLTRRVVRCVGVAAARMEEDRLRALRAIRFAGRFGFAIDPETWEAIRESAPHLTRLSMERVKQELDKIMEQVEQPSASLERYREAGILTVLLPSLAEAPVLRFRTIDFLARPARLRRPARRALRLAALFAEPGQGVPAALERTLKGLKFSNEEVALTRSGAAALAAVPSLAPVREQFAEERALRRFVATVGRLQVPLVARLLWARATAELASMSADAAAVREARLGGIRLYRRAMRIAWHDPITLGDLVIDGDDLRGIGIHSGPEIGATLKRLLESVLDDPTRNTRERLLALASVRT